MNEIIFKKPIVNKKDRLIDLAEMIYNYKKMYPFSEHYDFIQKMKRSIDELYEKSYKENKERFKKFQTLLLRYWKMYIVDSNGEKKPIMYVFPYKIREDNGYMFSLISRIDTGYNYDTGLHEHTFDIFQDNYFTENDVIFEEIEDYNEMVEHAKKSCEDALSERLAKLKYRDHVLE